MPSLCQRTHTVSLTSSERVRLVLQNIASVSSLIHEVQLSDDTYRPCPGGVHLFGHLKSIRVGQVSVSGGDSKDEAVLSSDELQEHVLDLVLNVTGLVPHRDLGHARQVHQGEIQHWGGREGEGGRKGEERGRKGGGRQAQEAAMGRGEGEERICSHGLSPHCWPVTFHNTASVAETVIASHYARIGQRGPLIHAPQPDTLAH